MDAADVVKIAIALGILTLVLYTFFRGNSWWWRLPMKTRITLAIFATVTIIAAGFFYQSQKGAFDNDHRSLPTR